MWLSMGGAVTLARSVRNRAAGAVRTRFWRRFATAKSLARLSGNWAPVPGVRHFNAAPKCVVTVNEASLDRSEMMLQCTLGVGKKSGPCWKRSCINGARSWARKFKDAPA